MEAKLNAGKCGFNSPGRFFRKSRASGGGAPSDDGGLGGRRDLAAANLGGALHDTRAALDNVEPRICDHVAAPVLGLSGCQSEAFVRFLLFFPCDPYIDRKLQQPVPDSGCACYSADGRYGDFENFFVAIRKPCKKNYPDHPDEEAGKQKSLPLPRLRLLNIGVVAEVVDIANVLRLG